MSISAVFLIVALILFAIGAWSRWWPIPTAERPYYPSLICGGLFFWVLSVVWTMVTK
jgi:hypothetical protein